MRYLIFSLITLVIVATISLGWLFDRVYQQSDSVKAPPSAVEVIEQFGSALAQAVDSSPKSAELLLNWPTDFDYSASLSTITNAELPSTLLDSVITGNVVLLESNDKVFYHYYLPNKQQILIVESPLYQVSGSPSALKYILSISFYLVLILILLFWLYPLLKQLASLRKAAKSFGEGKLDKRIHSSSISYIRDIENEFNNMASRIQNLLEDVKLLSAAVSHDLRTPLARIRFGLDTLQEVTEQNMRERLQDKLGDDVDEMTSLVESLLTYARLDQQMFELSKVAIDLSSLIEGCISKYNAKANGKQVAIEFIGDENREKVSADPTYLKMALNNVIQNAINYGQGQIMVELTMDSNHAYISVSDNGDGVAPELRANIVKPFVRGVNKNNKDNKGYGIGLAFVKRVVDWHQGQLDISDSIAMCGASFTITLPKASR
jgi:two-component system OmpR family sensor kinase